MKHILPSYYLSETEAMERVRDLEARYNLFDFTVDGYSVWRLLRVKATRLIQNLPWNVQPGKSQWRRPLRMLAGAVEDIPGLLFPQPAGYIIKTFSSYLVEKECGKWKDCCFDDLFKKVGTCFKIVAQNSPCFGKKRRKSLLPISISTNFIDLLAELPAKLNRTTASSDTVKELTVCLKSEPALHPLTAQSISVSLNRFFWSKRIYSRLLRRIQPEYVLVADTAEYAICAAARELSIQTIEFQHGIFTPNHPDVLPAVASADSIRFVAPDKLLLYGEHWKEGLDQNSFYADKLRVVGSPRIDRCRSARAANVSNRADDDLCRILLTTDGLARDQLLRFVVDFIEVAKGKIDYSLTIKLHPSFDTEKTFYISRFDYNDKVQIVEGPELPTTYELLARSDLHLSGASTCHFDALGCGVPTIVLPLPNYEVLRPLIDSGHAVMADSPDDLLRIVLGWHDLSVPSAVSAYYYEPNALANIQRELGIQ